MSRSERVGSDPDGLSGRWVLDPRLACGLVALETWAQCNLSANGFRWPGLFIISGYRSEADQTVLGGAQTSLHTRRPSLAADLRVGDTPASLTDPSIWAALGRAWTAGLPGARWGGDFSTPDYNHFDLGHLTQ